MWNPLGLAGYGSDDSDSASDAEGITSSSPPQLQEETPQISTPEEVPPIGLNPNPVPPATTIVALPELPELPDIPCNPATQAKIDKYLEHTERGLSFIESLRSKKEFDNPYILAKVVEYFGIEEMESNFSKDIFDPYGYDLDDYTDKLSMAVQREQERRAVLIQQNPALRWTLPNPLL